MTRRSARVLAPVALAFALGCQDYNFKPVSQCVIQPGSERVTLSDVSTADVLFVVDDSGSMKDEQDALAANFGSFVNALTQENSTRIANGQEPIDFHIAITTTSIYENQNVANCVSTCAGYAGQWVCCQPSGAAPLKLAQRCPSGGGCGAGNACRTDCAGYAGEPVCCAGANAAPEEYVPTCAQNTAPAYCGNLRTRYRIPASSTCIPGGPAADGAKYPQGDFVGQGANPRVIHFDASIYKLPDADRDAAIAQRVTQFQQNVAVGTCGSGQEQGLQASRLAIQKALSGKQKEADGSTAQWPHPSSKLVVVYLGDEDDCSSPQDPVAGVVMINEGSPDSCQKDGTTGRPAKRWPVSDFAAFLGGLNRPLGGGFVPESTCNTDPTTQDLICTANICCGTGVVGTCSGEEAGGVRFLQMADQMKAMTPDVVEASICTDFSVTLQRLANIVKMPNVLSLPTAPALSELTLLRIADVNGVTRKLADGSQFCYGPAPAGTTLAAAKAAAYDWWFIDTKDVPAGTEPAPSASPVTQFVWINHETKHCEANPGETYSLDYVGVVPEGGCASYLDCQAAFNPPGSTAPWQCCNETSCSSASSPASVSPRGTCLCG